MYNHKEPYQRNGREYKNNVQRHICAKGKASALGISIHSSQRNPITWNNINGSQSGNSKNYTNAIALYRPSWLDNEPIEVAFGMMKSSNAIDRVWWHISCGGKTEYEEYRQNWHNTRLKWFQARSVSKITPKCWVLTLK